MSITCSICGVEINDGENKCSFCGTAVENTSATVEEKPAPAVEKTSAPVVETPAPTVEEVKPESVATVPAAESKFVCSGCGKEYPAGTKFCSECGGKIEEKKPVIVQKEEAPKFVCTGCGKEYPAGTKFCSECGGIVAEKSAAQPVKKIVCTKCGKEYPDGGKFCSECGGKIEEKYDAMLWEFEKKREAWLANVSECKLIRDSVEYLKTATLESPTIVDAVMAAGCADYQALQIIYKNGFFKWDNPDIMCAAARTPFLENICSVYKLNSSINAKDSVYGKTALIWAAAYEQLDAVKYLVAQGADVNARGSKGETALLAAAGHNNLELVKYLVNQGADINAKNDLGSIPLFEASLNGHLAVVKYLIAQGADVNAKDESGWTALLNATHNCCNDIIQYLVTQGADVNAKDESGWTALMWAAHNGDLDTIKYLVTQGANVNVQTDEGETPLDRASGEGYKEISDFLKQHGAVAHETTITVAEKTPVEWIEEYFGDKVAELRTKSGWTAPAEYAYVATDTPFKYGLNKTNFTQGLQKLGITTNYDRCIMLFGVHHSGTWGANTTGGVITLDGIAWKEMDGNFYYFEWKDVSSIVQKTGGWKGEFIEVNGQYVIIEAMSDYFLGRENFAKFLSAISGCQVYRG